MNYTYFLKYQIRNVWNIFQARSNFLIKQGRYFIQLFFIPYWHQVLLSISIYTALWYILLSLLLFSFRLKNILKLYPLLKCTTSFSNIFHRNGYAIRPYILPFTILFTIHSHTDTHRHTLQNTHLNHTKIFFPFIEGLNKVY